MWWSQNYKNCLQTFKLQSDYNWKICQFDFPLAFDSLTSLKSSLGYTKSHNIEGRPDESCPPRPPSGLVYCMKTGHRVKTVQTLCSNVFFHLVISNTRCVTDLLDVGRADAPPQMSPLSSERFLHSHSLSENEEKRLIRTEQQKQAFCCKKKQQ